MFIKLQRTGGMATMSFFILYMEGEMFQLLLIFRWCSSCRLPTCCLYCCSPLWWQESARDHVDALGEFKNSTNYIHFRCGWTRCKTRKQQNSTGIFRAFWWPTLWGHCWKCGQGLSQGACCEFTIGKNLEELANSRFFLCQLEDRHYVG